MSAEPLSNSSMYLFSHRKVTAAAVAQMKRLWHTTCIYVTPPLQEYCEKLASLLPDPLNVRAACCPFVVFGIKSTFLSPY